jgi:hypothetical protein
MKHHSPIRSVIDAIFCYLRLNQSTAFCKSCNTLIILSIIFLFHQVTIASDITDRKDRSVYSTCENLLPPCFSLTCKDFTINLSSGQCGSVLDFLPEINNNCTTAINISILDTTLYKFGDFLPIGVHQICYIGIDEFGFTETCCMNVTVSPFPNPIQSIVCLSEVQYSLNEYCFATIRAEDILTGGPYSCFQDYVVELRDWYSNDLIDRDPVKPGPQVSKADIAKTLKVTVKETKTGNSCWSKITVEDKLPPLLICPPDVRILCGTSSTHPDCTGVPSVSDNCGTYTLTYYDDMLYGDCGVMYQERIERKWTAIDEYGNKSSCTQIITVLMATLADVYVPLDYNDYDLPSLLCDEKVIPSHDHSAHILPAPYCVDGYLLDSVYWFATGGFLPSPAGDLAGIRRPKTLGWNCLDTGKYKGHPSPFPIYYPAHPEWKSGNTVCWGPDQVVKWLGTGVPNKGQCINLSLNYVDQKIDLAKPNCDAGIVGCFKILRQWTVMDWCTSQVGGHNQIIKVVDKKAPSVIFPDSVLVNIQDWTCSGKYEVPQPWITDNCSNDLHYSVTVESGLVLGNDIAGYLITDIKPGIWNAYIVAEDCCGNVTRKRFVINAQDNTPPSPICNKLTAVSIIMNPNSGESYAQVMAKDLDQSSFDNCSPHVFFKVIRMEQLRGTTHGSAINQADNGLNCAAVNGDDHPSPGNQIFFDDYARFCCNDIGKTIRVVVRVFDREVPEGPVNPGLMGNNGIYAGRFNDCMVDIEVQEKTLPVVQAPPDIVVSCSFWFDIAKLSNPNDETFGRVVTQVSQRKKVITKDVVCHKYCVANPISGYPGYIQGASPSNPPAWNKACDFYRVLFDTAHENRIYDLTWGFDGTVLGACGTNFTILVNDNRDCGQGSITRTITATGPNGITVRASQLIWVVDCDPFYINRADPCDPNDDITWPGICNGQAITLQGCGADISPDNPRLGRPVIENNSDDLCSLISVEYFDEIFTIEPDACFKVVRKWVVIDWCQYDPNRSATIGRWEYLQVIKVNDVSKPSIHINIGACVPAIKNPANNICHAYIEMNADATDNCSPANLLLYEYKIDLYNDGKGAYSGFDYMVGSLSQKQFLAGKIPYRRFNPQAVNDKDPFDASGTYPIGIHKICWFVEDACGNISTTCKLFEIKDCKPPTPYCYVGLITTVMPSSGCVTVWARDFDLGSFDNCSESKNLKIYFEFNNSDSLTICCDEFERNKVNDDLSIPISLCIEDEEGNKACCRTGLMVQDPVNVCPDVGSNARISGIVETMSGELTKDVTMQLFEQGILKKQIITNSTGSYLFGDLPYGPTTEFIIKAKRNDDALNGVTTADIVKIQRHILGQETMQSPYQWIAADVNNSASITASDISEIRKLVLGVTHEFDKMESWTFIPRDYNMDPNFPWNAPKDIKLNLPIAKEYIKDFISIKLGDVNNSARANNTSDVIVRNHGVLQFEIDTHQLVAGELYKVDFTARNFSGITGYQFSIGFDPGVISVEGFETGALKIEESNFGLQNKNKGIITTSWNSNIGQTHTSGAVLFSLVFRAIKEGKIENLISINSVITKAEAYDQQVNTLDVSLGLRSEQQNTDISSFELFQNTPNPFDKETIIHFVLPEELKANLSIYDVAGKLVSNLEIAGRKGWNQIKVKKDLFKTSGVYYYQLNAGNYSSTKRMVLE